MHTVGAGLPPPSLLPQSWPTPLQPLALTSLGWPVTPRRRAKLEQELQAYGSQLSEEQRRAALAEHEMREREYSRLQVRLGPQPLRLRLGNVRAARVGRMGPHPGAYATTWEQRPLASLFASLLNAPRTTRGLSGAALLFSRCAHPCLVTVRRSASGCAWTTLSR